MLIVGGTFDKNGGKPSHFISLMQKFFNCKVINGGDLKSIYSFHPQGTDVLLWMPNIDNSEDKILERLKVMNPHMLLISSKRVIEQQYTDYELVNRAIKAKANLSIIIRRRSTSGNYNFSIIDPLGNTYCKEEQFTTMLHLLLNRINELQQTKRIGSQQAEFDVYHNQKNINPKFISIVQHFGRQFTNIIQANNPDRFLGNASTRCEWGFPSQRTINPVNAFVSKRNVDKEDITENNFVKTYLTKDKVFYHGNHKPSVDTPVQLMLYERLPNINYMIHGHCYVKYASFTKNKVPCGDIREVKEIMNLIENNNCTFYTFYVINLLGHGCIIMANTPEQLKNVSLIKRPLLEQ